MTEKSKPDLQVTPELAEALARYAGIPVPAEGLGGTMGIVQGLVNAQAQIDDALLRDVDPAHIQPIRREGR